MDNVFCTNSICSPEPGDDPHRHLQPPQRRGQHRTPASTTGSPPSRRHCVPAGYATALFGKWHLGHDPENLPRGFDDWRIFPGQGEYHDPVMISAGPDGVGRYEAVEGYATDIVTDLSLDWLDTLEAGKPFCLLVHHKAPHRPWEPDAAHADLYADVDIPEPDTLFDDYATRTDAARAATMRVADDLDVVDVKAEVPTALEGDDAVVDRTAGTTSATSRTTCAAWRRSTTTWAGCSTTSTRTAWPTNTIVVYTSDQGFFLGDHGWYDKRFIYEESLRMPMLVRWPGHIDAGSTSDAMVTNTDFAQTILTACGLDPAAELPSAQGRSFARRPGRERPGRLAHLDVLPVLGTRRPESPCARPLRCSHAEVQARVLLQRRARDRRIFLAHLPARLGDVRPRERSGRAAQRGRRCPRTPTSGPNSKASSPCCRSSTATRRINRTEQLPDPTRRRRQPASRRHSSRRRCWRAGSATGAAASSRRVYGSLRRPQHPGRAPVLDDAAALHDGDPAGELLDDRQVVADEQAGEADARPGARGTVRGSGPGPTRPARSSARRRSAGRDRARSPARWRRAGADRRTSRAGSARPSTPAAGPTRAAPRPG